MFAKILLATSILPWVVSISSAQSKDIETQILGLMERLRSASVLSDPRSQPERARRRATLKEILSDNYVRVSADGTFLSKAEVLDAYVPSGVSSVRYENMRVFDFEGGTAIAICLERFDGRRQTPPWIAARVFTREGASWRLIGEDAGPPFRPLLPKEVEFPLIARRNPVVSRNESEEAEVRAFIERQRLAVDPQVQKAYGRVGDRQAAAAALSTDYLKVWWTNDGWTNDNGPDLTQRGTGAGGTREQFVADTNPKADDPRHLQMNDPNAFIRWENVNVAVIGNAAIVTYRSLSQRTNKRVPPYTVFRAYERRADGWLNIFSFR